MPFQIGTQIGTYKIVARIGAGGMGEVWRAHDEKLGRDVAIKTVRDDFTRDAERMARFRREAKVLASLNHPNIASIYDFKDADDVSCLILEFVEGETLAERIARGALPLDEALDIARQIAEALGVAHDKGIVHRDLKPANIKITPEGRVKVLDFGLAKFFETQVSAASLSGAPTVEDGHTNDGILLGTTAYMSPEQARGRAVTKQTDIWALGCCLFEMITGKLPFDGNFSADIIAGIIDREPQWGLLPSTVPDRVTDAVRDCLKKNPVDRFHDVNDVRIQITNALKTKPESHSRSVPTPRTVNWITAAIGIVGILICLAAWIAFRPAAAVPRMVRFKIALSSGNRLVSNPIMSPDGSAIAYVASDRDGTRRIWWRDLQSLASSPIPNTEDVQFGVFWSPDGKSLGYFSSLKLKVVTVAGGTRVICDVPPHIAISNGSWSSRGTIIYAVSENLQGGIFDTSIYKVDTSSGTAEKVQIDDGEKSRWFPTFLPDGDHFLYVAFEDVNSNTFKCRVGSLSSKTSALLPIESEKTFYVPGYLLFLRNNSVRAQAFDIRTFKVVDPPFTVAQNVNSQDGWPGGDFSASDSGVLAYKEIDEAVHGDLVWVDRSGKKVAKVQTPSGTDFLNPVFSHNGKYVAVNGVDSTTGVYSVWLVETDRGVPTRFTPDSGTSHDPVWSPDDKSIAYIANRNSKTSIFRKSLSATSTEELLTDIDSDGANIPNEILTDWSSDGNYLVYSDRYSSTKINSWVHLVNLKQRSKAPLLRVDQNLSASFSPDASWIAYQAVESGDWRSSEIFVQSFPDLVTKYRVSEHGGMHPRWSGTSAELYFETLRGTMMESRFKSTAGVLKFESPDPLFDRQVPIADRHHFAVEPGGKRFLVRETPETTGDQITVVTNWIAGLKGK